MYSLVRELAADGIPVAVTCRVLNIARQPYCRWLAGPVTDAELVEAYRAKALFDAHGDDPEFGYRFLADEAAAAGEVMAQRTAWRICSTNGWFSRFGKKPKRGKGTKAGPPVHDDLVRRDVTADAPNQLWPGGITEHRTLVGTLYLCVIKDVFSNRIVGYPRRLADEVPHRGQRAELRRRPPRGCGWLRAAHGSWIAVSKQEARPRTRASLHGRVHGPGRRGRGQRCHGQLLQPAAEERPRPPDLGHPRTPAHRDRHSDRADLPPPPTPSRPRPMDPDRVRDHHDHTGHQGRLTATATYPSSRPPHALAASTARGVRRGRQDRTARPTCPLARKRSIQRCAYCGETPAHSS